MKENHKMDKGKGGGKKRSSISACLDEEEMDSRNVEIPESGSNSARRHINMANVLGGGNGWGRKNWEKECPGITDTGFNG